MSGLSYILPVATAQCPTAGLPRYPNPHPNPNPNPSPDPDPNPNPTPNQAGLPRLALDEALFNTTITVAFPEEGAKPYGKVEG